jgi:hypothetical protein
MKKHNTFSKVLAYIALFAIIVSIIGTWIIFIMSSSQQQPVQTTDTPTLTIEQLQEMLWTGSEIENIPLEQE